MPKKLRHFRKLFVHELENRVTPAVVTWDGGGGDNLWTTASNWVGDVLPTANDDVQIDVPAKVAEIILNSGNVFVQSLNTAENFRLQGSANLTLTKGASLLSGEFTGDGRTLSVVNPGTTASITGAATFAGGTFLVNTQATLTVSGVVTASNTNAQNAQINLLASNGASLSLPNLIAINQSSVGPCWVRIAADSGGIISLPALTSVSDPAAGETRSRSFRFEADGAGSKVDIPLLTSINDVNGNNDYFGIWFGRSRVIAINGGNINAPSLTALNNVDLTYDATGGPTTGALIQHTNGTLTLSGVTKTFPALTQLTGTTINISSGANVTFSVAAAMPSVVLTVDASTFTAPAVVNIDDSDIILQGNSKVTLSGVESITNGNYQGAQVNLVASGGSVLSLPNLKSITGSQSVATWVRVAADSGGLVSLPALVTLSDPNAGDTRSRSFLFDAAGIGSKVDIPLLAALEDRNTNNDAGGVWQGLSRLTATGGGTVNAPSLVSLNCTAVAFTPTSGPVIGNLVQHTNGILSINGITKSFTALSQLTGTTINISGNASVSFSAAGSLDAINLTIDSSEVTAAALTSINDIDITLLNGSKLTLPGVETISGGNYATAQVNLIASGKSVLSLPNLKSMTASTAGASWIRVSADTGGQVSLPALASLSDPNVGDTRSRSFRFEADGTGSKVDIPVLTSIPDINSNNDYGSSYFGRSQLKATNGGIVNAPILTVLNNVDLAFDAAGGPTIGAITQHTNGSFTLSGITRTFAALENLDGTTMLVQATANIDLPAAKSFVSGNLTLDAAILTLPVLNNIDDADITVRGGSSLSVVGVTSANNGNYQGAQINFNASSSGTLSLPNLVSITGSTAAASWVRAFAETGGQINLPLLKVLSDPNSGDTRSRSFLFDATGAGSSVNLPALTSLEDRSSNNDFGASWQGNSRLLATNGGAVNAPNLTVLNCTALTFDPTGGPTIGALTQHTNGTFNFTSVTRTFPLLTAMNGTVISVSGGANISLPAAASLVSGNLTVNASVLTMPALVNIDDTDITVLSGSSLSLPGVTAVTNGNYVTAQLNWSAASGASLTLPNLATITGSTSGATWVRIFAETGATINLPSLKALTDPDAGDTRSRSFLFDAIGVNSKITLPALISLEDRNSNNDFGGSWQGRSRLYADQGGFIDTAANVVLSRATVTVVSDASIIDGGFDLGAETTLGGKGTIMGTVLNRFGVVNPGGANTPGRLTITGSYSQLFTATLEADLAGPSLGDQYDQLVVAGTATLNGNLSINRIGGYIPPDTQTFNILNANLRSGLFSTTLNNTLPGTRFIVPIYLTDSVRLVINAGPVLVTPTTGLITTETGVVSAFTIVLNTAPTADVTIELISTDTTEGTVSPLSLTFTTTNWNTPQVVTVTGVEDALNDGDIAYSIITSPCVSADPAYNGFNPSDVSVINVDNEAFVPRIESTTIDAGGPQRSMIRSITVAFTLDVAIQPNAFSITGFDRQGQPIFTRINVATQLVAGRTVATLTFRDSANNPLPGNSLIDGDYLLTINGQRILAGGFALDADDNGSPGGYRNIALHRLFGDGNGDRNIDASDFSQFGNSFGQTLVASPFDYDGNGSIDSSDFAQFGNRFGVTL